MKHNFQRVVACIMQSCNTSLSRRAETLWREGAFNALVNLDIHPSDYARAEFYFRDAQVISCVRKLSNLDTGVDLRAEAVKSFYESEQRCAYTNSTIAPWVQWFDEGFFGDIHDLSMFNFIRNVRTRVGNILGPVPKDLTPKISKGSTYGDRGDEITILHKMDNEPTCTSEAWSVLRDLFRDTAWARCKDTTPRIVRGNRFTTVPKDSRKDRGICIEPSLNVAYQLSVGTHIRERLYLKTGIDIKGTNGQAPAQITHRRRAREASVSGQWSTIDLSNASDTVAKNLVKLLLPKAWYEVLDSLRSHYTEIDGRVIALQKFSSMGNGFTFELETLLFFALMAEISAQPVSVYGDDIIIASVDGSAALQALKVFGFAPNMRKCHVDSTDPFRESCGGDFFNGEAVRPYFLKEEPSDPLAWMELANQLLSMSKDKRLWDEPLLKARAFCIQAIPSRLRHYGPLWVDSGVIHDDDCQKWHVRERHANFSCVKTRTTEMGYRDLKVLQPQQIRVKIDTFSPLAVLASALAGCPSTGPVPRDGIRGFKSKWRATVM